MGLAILGHHADSGTHRVAWSTQPQRAPVGQADVAAIGTIGAEDGAQRLGAARAHQPGQTEDLAAPHLETHIANGGAASQVLDPQRDRRCCTASLGAEAWAEAALTGRQLRSSRWRRRTQCATGSDWASALPVISAMIAARGMSATAP